MLFNLTYCFKGIRPCDPRRTEQREYTSLEAAMKGAIKDPPADLDPDEPEISISGSDGVILAWVNPWNEWHEYTRAALGAYYG